MQLAIVGASGGIGTSTLACSVALGAAQDAVSTVLVELKACSGGIDFLLGLENDSGLRWPQLAGSADFDGAGLASCLLKRDDLTVLSAGAPHPRCDLSTQRAVLSALDDAFELTVLDAAIDERTTALRHERDHVVLSVAATCQGVRAAQAAIHSLESRGQCLCCVSLVVGRDSRRSMSARTVQDALGLPLIASWVRDPRLGVLIESGDLETLRRGPRDGIASAASALLDELLRPRTFSAADVVSDP